MQTYKVDLSAWLSLDAAMLRDKLRELADAEGLKDRVIANIESVPSKAEVE